MSHHTIRTRNVLRLVEPTPRTLKDAGLHGLDDEHPTAGGFVAMLVAGGIGSVLFLWVVLGWM